jgi:hypothetical protein
MSDAELNFWGPQGATSWERKAKKPGPLHHLAAQSDCLLANGVRQITYSLEDAEDIPISGYYVTEHQANRATKLPDPLVTKGDNRNGPGTSSGTNDGMFFDLIGGTDSFDNLQTFTVSTTPPGQSGAVNIPVFIVDDSGNAYGTNGVWYDPSIGAFVNGTVANGQCN